ncbi:MAG: ATP-binding cassette domain-containing protein [Myxococcota bacterium]|nr:ATP-binding cassette domain-containing protein [Myxococcota bacterium]
MPFVHLESLAFAHANADPLFTDVSAVLPPGWTGLVGDNGAGKSTLLQLIAGDLSPSRGAVRLDPPDARVLLCSQTADAFTRETGLFAEAYDRSAVRLRARLALDPEGLVRWPSLSPGERRRWQVGTALFLEPDVLILDEPTDHLDADARELLVAALARFRGAGLVVSHDRTLLDRLTERTLCIQHGRVEMVRGPYSVARAEWDRATDKRVREHERLRREEKRTRRRLQVKREQLDRAQAMTSSRKRMKNAGDHDARSMMAKEQARAGAGKAAHGVRILKAQVERAAERSQAHGLSKQRGRSLFVSFEPAEKSVLMSARAPTLWAGDTAVLHDLDVVVRRDDRVWLRGRNGAGKTTLLGALLEGARIPRERLLHVPQELDPARVTRQQRELRGLPEDLRGRVGSLIAALGADPEQLMASERLSPGEARKLALAFGLGRQVLGVVLDEPTNHLDIGSVERLEAALCDYPGALLLVTHDEALGRRCTRSVWQLEDGSLRAGSVPAAPASSGG